MDQAKTLGQLKQTGYRYRPVKEELRENVLPEYYVITDLCSLIRQQAAQAVAHFGDECS